VAVGVSAIGLLVLLLLLSLSSSPHSSSSRHLSEVPRGWILGARVSAT
jgi:hypothetical protein